ncbi:hypothetical protein [Mesorhizobium sp. CN2-181]|uniref:hypothetical protein n=1 Tax=Mesorhizobium yinganensis TaxID=3157707 RepID=UPI0032B7479E
MPSLKSLSSIFPFPFSARAAATAVRFQIDGDELTRFNERTAKGHPPEIGTDVGQRADRVSPSQAHRVVQNIRWLAPAADVSTPPYRHHDRGCDPKVQDAKPAGKFKAVSNRPPTMSFRLRPIRRI